LQRAVGNQAVLGLFRARAEAHTPALGPPAPAPPVDQETSARPVILRAEGLGQSHDPNSTLHPSNDDARFGQDFSHIPAPSQNAPLIQPRLVIGGVDTSFEREADFVADQVIDVQGNELTPGAAQLTRKLAGTGEGVATPAAQGVDRNVASEISALKGGGASLPEASRTFFKARLGHDFSTVRIHSDSRAATLAGSLNARAFTLAPDIVFGRGAYSPGTDDGSRLLAHELAHVVQQHSAQATIQRQPKLPPPKQTSAMAELADLNDQIRIIGEAVLPQHILDLPENKGIDMSAQDTMLFQRKLAAISKLGDLKNEGAVITLIAVMEDKVFGVSRLDPLKKSILRPAAVESLAQVGGTAALAKLNDLLNSPDPKERQLAARALSRSPGNQGVATLLAALKAEKDKSIKASIITALGKVGSGLGNQEKAAIEKELVGQMQGTAMAEVLPASINALGELKLRSSVDPLMKQLPLWLSDPKLTQDIIRALGEIRDEKAVYLLVPLLGPGAKTKFVKIETAGALGKIGSSKAIAALRKRLTLEADDDVKKAISQAIP
jgi:HEAT repeat protein